MLDNRDFLSSVTAIVKKKTDKAADVGSMEDDRLRIFVDVTYGSEARTASSSDRPPMDITDQRSNKKAYLV